MSEPPWVVGSGLGTDAAAGSDGNAVELYVDTHPEEWRADPSAVVSAAPLNL